MLAGLRYAGQSAQSHRRLVCADVRATAVTLRIATNRPASACDAALTGPDAGTHWAALTKAAEKAFPGYDLGFMVTYGVYGLALARAR